MIIVGRRDKTHNGKCADSSALALFFLSLLFFVLEANVLHAQSFKVMCWNVENLFDTRHDSLKNDQEFTPDAMRHWNYSRYKKKLADISVVISTIGGWTPPALVGLCEVENDSVMIGLTRYSPLKELDYRYVMTHSSDIRGIDVALLYQRDQFKLINHRSIHITPFNKTSRPTRDILHVSGLLITGDTLDVFVCHFPSRSGGNYLMSEPYRLHVAQQLRTEADSILSARAHPQVIIMGDFNDYPENRSIKEVLNALPPIPPIVGTNYYHLLARKAAQQKLGTYKYQGQWNLLDHLIVSGTLLDSERPFYTNETYANIARLPILLIDDERNFGDKPFRTYLGLKYQGGISDHLPVYVDFKMNVKD